MAEDAHPNPPEKPPASFGGLAKKIRSRTTDLLAIAIIVIGGFAVGGKVSQWWQTDDVPTERAGPNAAGSATPVDAPVELDFGKSPFTLNRRILKGKRDSALKQLTELCGEIADKTPPPAQPADKAEKQLLTALSGEKPVQELPNRRVYLKDGPVPLAVVTAGAESSVRVVCWGLAFPSGENRWTAYAFHAASPGGNNGSVTTAVIPLPSNARPILTIRGRGNAWRTFRSKQSLAETKRFYTEWFKANGWSESAMNDGKTGWTAVYITETNTGKQRAELQVSRESAETITGVVFIQQNSD